MRDRHGRHETVTGSPLLVGVHPRQHPEVLEKAHELASRLDLVLVFAFVLDGTDRSEWRASETLDFDSLHPDEREEIDGSGIEEVRQILESSLPGGPLVWSLRVLLGNPAKALAQVARELDAAMIIVGSHRRMFSSPKARFIHASTVSRLLARQDIPVLVVPPAVGGGARLQLDP